MNLRIISSGKVGLLPGIDDTHQRKASDCLTFVCANRLHPASPSRVGVPEEPVSGIAVISMFNFFFRRFSRNRSSLKETLPSPTLQRPAEAESADLARSRLKSDALQNAAAFDRNEDAAVEFILQCEFADARLAAARNIHSRNALEKVRRAMRDTDRRVAKLMQSRLDALERQRLSAEAAARCIDMAQALLAAPQLAPNQVAQLDRTWKALNDVAQPQRSNFETARAALTARLADQASLQRRAIDIGEQLRQLRASLTDSADAACVADAASATDTLAAEVAQLRSAPEAASIPTAAIAACEEGVQGMRATLEGAFARQTVLSAREEALVNWSDADPASLDPAVLRKAWKDTDPTNVLRSGADGMASAQQQRFDVLLQKIDAARKPAVQAAARDAQPVIAGRPLTVAETTPPDLREVDAALAALDEALEQGSLRAAQVQDRLLREMGAAAVRADGRGARLASARARLAQLKDWARWGGTVSREELLKRAQELPAREADPAMLAERVGDLRSRWKSLDASAGPAPRELWEQFDAACNLAYEPAAAHFAAQTAARDANLASAHALAGEVEAFAVASGLASMPSLPVSEPAAEAADPSMTTPVDWKNVAQFCSRVMQQWQRLGPISRKERKQVRERFDAALRLLQEPLMREQHAAAQRREVLITQVTAIDPLQRGALDSLRALQQRWQDEAKTLPLTRSAEQQLWQRFRDACDAVIASRRDRLDAADTGRRANLEKRQALCAALETAATANEMTDAEIGALLRDMESAWINAGEVPRGTQQEIDERYLRAADRLRARIDEAQRVVQETQWQALDRRLTICREAEQALFSAGDIIAADDARRLQWQNEWLSLPILPNGLQQALQRRFDAVLSASEANGEPGGMMSEASVETRRGLLQANRDALKQEVLRLEILAGAETPAVYHRERLRMQVDGLQTALKSGREAVTLGVQLQRLCGLPALTDDETAQRIKRVLAAAKRAEPSAIGRV